MHDILYVIYILMNESSHPPLALSPEGQARFPCDTEMSQLHQGSIKERRVAQIGEDGAKAAP